MAQRLIDLRAEYFCFISLYFVSPVLSVGLKGNFGEVSVNEVDCPDLTAAPYHLAGHGLSGSPTIVEIGGPPYLLPTVDRAKLYDLVAVGRKILPNATEFIAIGAGAGPHPYINSNCEVSEPIQIMKFRMKN